jgi:hypothetical protein
MMERNFSMKVRSNLTAGMTFAECDAQRNYWKSMAQSTPNSCGSSSSSGGGYVNGVWYPDQSGVCNTGTTPPPTTGGGYVGGVWYPDQSGVCL